MDIVEKLRNILEKDIENLGYELVDIEFIGPRDGKRLIFYIYNEEGITIDDCERVSGFLDEKLDELDLIKNSYYLEVSSQDLSRPLKTDRDLLRNKDELLKVKLKDGNLILTRLKEIKEESIVFADEEGKDNEIDKSDIKEIKIEIVF
ncbi:ribosome maturation factor RimP [uncultured Anaerococcus sp.]|uniref:ribosome maturation factor RimP n=1 Tax=uncultured Anaerococcus sp. TaxID=293428 RepID=UPI0025CD9732|nr:ribosome maturation factor RimP [uncultured Anaerococcus sp.]